MTQRLLLSVSFLTSFFLFNVVKAQGQEKEEARKVAPAAAPAQVATAPASSAAPTLPAPLAHALGLYRTGKLDEARAEYETLTKSAGPEGAAAYAGLARVLLKEKKVAEADAAAAKSLELSPNLAVAHSARGEVYFREAKLAEAEQEFLIPARANQPDARALYGLTRIYWATSNYKRAQLFLDRAHQLDSADPEIRKHWLLTLKLEDRLKALKEYLASESNDEPEERKGLEHYLVVLNDQVGQSKHACRLVTKITSTQSNLIPLMIDPIRIRGYALDVNINGTSSKLLLDTGAGGIVINSRIAEKAGVQRVVEQAVRGIGSKGAANGYIGYAESIKIGDLEFQGCHVMVLDKKRSLGDDGLIGADVFEDFLVDIDFPNKKFRLSGLPPLPEEATKQVGLQSGGNSTERLHDRYVAPEMKSYEKLFRFGHDLLISTFVNNLPPKLFLIDTAAFDNAVSVATAREATKVHGDPDTKVKGLSGAVDQVYRTDELTLTFGNFRQKRNDLVAFDLTSTSDSVGTEVGGVLGFGMLWLLEIKIDYRDGLIQFTTSEENRIR